MSLPTQSEPVQRGRLSLTIVCLDEVAPAWNNCQCSGMPCFCHSDDE